MALLAFQKPENILMLESTPTFGRFEFKPLEPGYGMTIGNALRRILLSSPEGFAINSLKIDGVDHEFATVPGVLEDVTNIILNLKQIRLKQRHADALEETVVIKVNGKDTPEFSATQLNTSLVNFEVLNKDLVICHLDSSASFTIQLTIDRGRGWVPAEDIVANFSDPCQIAIDAIYTPIVNVRINVDNARVGQRTDYDRLLLDVETDGSITPMDALKQAASILIEHFTLIIDGAFDMELEEEEESLFDEDTLRVRQLLKSKLSDLGLSVRALNCLRAAEVETVGELVKFTRSELLKFRNFGKKSLTEIEELMEKLGLTFGMEVSKYKLDKE